MAYYVTKNLEQVFEPSKLFLMDNGHGFYYIYANLTLNIIYFPVPFSNAFLSYIPIGELIFLNEATFLDNLRNRYFKDKIYVSS